MLRRTTEKIMLPRIFADKRGLIGGHLRRSAVTFLCAFVFAAGCKSVIDRQNVVPRVLRDVPARNLAYRLSADVTPPSSEIEDLDKVAAVANDFST
ncbi:MAG TPA: hypothetical protein VGC73_13775, partial [Pyrinomonadaceae bacterium]